MLIDPPYISSPIVFPLLKLQPSFQHVPVLVHYAFRSSVSLDMDYHWLSPCILFLQATRTPNLAYRRSVSHVKLRTNQ